MMGSLARQGAAVLLGLGLLVAPPPASASRVAVDGFPGSPVAICTAGTPCSTPQSLQSAQATLPTPFVANFGFGDFTSLYIYNNGLISVNGSLAASTNFSSLANVASANPGLFVFTAGYIPGQTYSGGIDTGFRLQGPLNSFNDFPGSPVVRVDYDNHLIQFSIYKFASGNYGLAFDYGDFNDNVPAFTTGSYAGYAYGGRVVSLTPQQLTDAAANAGGFVYTFSPAAAPAIPEPSTWLMLILGFTAIGVAARQKQYKPALVS